MVESYLSEESDPVAVSAMRFLTVLREFMEGSNLAEYEVRLDIIYAFHCQVVHLDPSERRGKGYFKCL